MTTPDELAFWRALAEDLASTLPTVHVLEAIERRLAQVANPATAERLRDHMRLLLGLDRVEMRRRSA